MELILDDSVRFIHVLAVCMGLGASVFADMLVLSRLRRPVDDDLLIVLHRLHGIIWLALLAMWVSGVGIIYLKTGFEIANFTPKLFAKILTVLILTFNALLIGSFAFPFIKAAKGQIILSFSTGKKLGLALVGGLSGASWVLALAMGVSSTLALSTGTVFLALMPAVYFGAIVSVFVILNWMARNIADTFGAGLATAD